LMQPTGICEQGAAANPAGASLLCSWLCLRRVAALVVRRSKTSATKIFTTDATFLNISKLVAAVFAGREF
ncbi:hypothetical protein, partial [Streptococcus pseudopneumoniae]|uniref:hypothetical protein n=1 Tax=Streptococcus pseudopneumoniae TaxID=257758 RepID=UPI0019D56456